MSSFWSWLWERIQYIWDPDAGIIVDRETVQEAVELIHQRLAKEAERRQVADLRIEDLSEEDRQALFRELEHLLKPKVNPANDTSNAA